MTPEPDRPPLAGAEAILGAIDRLATAIAATCSADTDLVAAGIADGGVPVAEALAQRLETILQRPVRRGVVDILFHRDDIGTRPIPKVTFPTDIDGGVDGADILLCDDVLHTGRTVRAALNEVFDQGRPERVRLAVLVDRGDRRLPIQPDFTGITVALDEGRCAVLENRSAQATEWGIADRPARR